MEKQDYQVSISVEASADKVFKCINNVKGWWSENLKGDSENQDGVFTIDFGGDIFVTHKLVEVVPNKKVVWLVTDCYLSWLKDKSEWTNTKVVFNISTEGNLTTIHFTHIGLVPQVECYNDCVKGWEQYIKGSLQKLITEGEGQPQKKK